MIPVYKPYLNERNLKYAHDALDSTWVSSNGRYIELAEERLRTLLNVKHVLLTANGTVANHLMAKCLRLRTNQRNIIVPSNAYVAAWNPFLYDRFFRLIPVDMDLGTWNADLEGQLHKAENLLVVHNLGNVENVAKIVMKYPHLNIVEDACEAFGGLYFNKGWHHAGTKSLCSTFSFYGNKNITSGEGGAFVTNDDELYAYAKHIWGQAQDPSQKFIHTDIGYNYRMTNVQAAILYGQLLDWDTIRMGKRSVMLYYQWRLQDVKGISLQKFDQSTVHSNWMFGVRFHNNPSYEYAKAFFHDRGIETRPFFYTINKHKHLPTTHNFVNGSILEQQVVVFPSYPQLETKQLEIIAEEIEHYARILEGGIL